MDGDTTYLDQNLQRVASALDDHDPTTQSEIKTYSWAQRYFEEVRNRAWKFSWGKEQGPGPDFEIWIRNSGDFQPESIGYKRYLCPINWPGDGLANGEKLGEMMMINWNVSSFLHI